MRSSKLLMKNMETIKIRNQVKSKFYYWFWGIATISVFTGQLYVGSGYRKMADTNDAISADINLLVETLIAPKIEIYQEEDDYYYRDYPTDGVIR